MYKTFLFDLDDTLADCSHRHEHIRKTPPDWETWQSLVHLDKPISPVVELTRALTKAGHRIVIFTGRTESCRGKTIEWLMRHGIPHARLLMCKNGDTRHDIERKTELVDSLGRSSIAAVIEDRVIMARHWRSLGLTCLQVAENDF